LWCCKRAGDTGPSLLRLLCFPLAGLNSNQGKHRVPPGFSFHFHKKRTNSTVSSQVGFIFGLFQSGASGKVRATTECDVQSARCLGRLLEENTHASARRVRNPSQGFVTGPQPQERHRVGRSDLVSELTGLGWRNGGEGRSSARAARFVAHLEHITLHEAACVAGASRPSFLLAPLIDGGLEFNRRDAENLRHEYPRRTWRLGGVGSLFICLERFLCHNCFASWRFNSWSRRETSRFTRDCISVSANF
jgi:hypothetical protein